MFLLLYQNFSDVDLSSVKEFAEESYLPNSDELLGQLNSTRRAACSWVTLASNIQINLFKVHLFVVFFFCLGVNTVYGKSILNWPSSGAVGIRPSR